MYSAIALGKKYLNYYFAASNGKGHGVHSPFVFEFITKVLNNKKQPAVFKQIEQQRELLKKDSTRLHIEDFGAGSVVSASKTRRVNSIARTALKPKKYGQLMHRMINHYMATRVVELGTSLGITSSYLASANPLTKVYTFEGSKEIAAVARKTFDDLALFNIKLIEGNFDDTLPAFLEKHNRVDFAFIDGNHRKEPTLRYFHQLLKASNEHSIFVFDDIHWSEEMEAAWEEIKQHEAVTLTIDLFYIGVVFFRKEQKVPQHFTIRY
jgi:predicted O-methyltransferase YrrM